MRARKRRRTREAWAKRSVPTIRDTQIYPFVIASGARLFPSPLVGEGAGAKRRRMRGMSPQALYSRREPLIRRFAPPSPTRGEGRSAVAYSLVFNPHRGANGGHAALCPPTIRHCVISCVTARRANHWVRGAVAAARRARKKFSQGELAHERRPRADERRGHGRQSRVVLAPVAGVKPAEVLRNPTGFRRTFNPPAMEARGIRLQGEHGISRKPIAQGMPGCSGCTCMLVCVSSALFAHETAGASRRPAFPAPS
jgi:hypothetical protein